MYNKTQLNKKKVTIVLRTRLGFVGWPRQSTGHLLSNEEFRIVRNDLMFQSKQKNNRLEENNKTANL